MRLVSKIMPRFVTESQFWAWLRLFYILFFRVKGRLRYNKEASCWVVYRSFGRHGKQLPVVVRSFKEFRRYLQFGANKQDIVFTWLTAIKGCKSFYDIGAANGLEGLLVGHLHDSKIVFLEPFTPSVESILRNIFVLAKHGEDHKRYNVIHAGCDSKPSYDRVYMLCVPKAGETQVSFSDPDAYERRGRTFEPVVSQFVAGVSIDDIHYKHGIEMATHIKIDVDGFENRVIEGASRTIESGIVESWAIEITGDSNMDYIQDVFAKNDYVEIARWEHYPGLPARTFDVIFARNSLADHYRRILS